MPCFVANMVENRYANTRYPPATTSRNNFMPMISPNFSTATYGPILEPNQAYNMLENMTNYSSHWPSEHAEFFKQDGTYSIDSIELLTTQVAALSSQIAAMNNGGRTHSGAAAFFNGNISSMEEKGSSTTMEAMSAIEVIFTPTNINNNGSYNHEKFLYASYSDERKSSLEDIFVEFATTLSKMIDYNEQKFDDLKLHKVDLGARLNNLANQMCQIATAVTAPARENVVDDDDDKIESTSSYDEHFPSKHEEGRNGKEERYTFVDDISSLPYTQHATQLFEPQSNQALENFKKLPTNNFL